MAEIVVELCFGERSALGDKTALSDPLATDGTTAAYFISGGVGQLLAIPTSTKLMENGSKFMTLTLYPLKPTLAQAL